MTSSRRNTATVFDPQAPPTGTGCVECLDGQGPGWWLHLRRCAGCGHIGCCDSSPSQHGKHHAHTSGHRVAQSFEPGENWFWDYTAQAYVDGPDLALPHAHPLDQPAPGPPGLVPLDWVVRLH